MGVIELRIEPHVRFGLLRPDRIVEGLRATFSELSVSVKDALKEKLDQAEKMLARAAPKKREHFAEHDEAERAAERAGVPFQFAIFRARDHQGVRAQTFARVLLLRAAG